MFSFSKLKEFFHKHEARLSALTLASGFFIDYLTLKRVDYWLDNIFIVAYLIIAGGSILIINVYEAGRFHNKFTFAVYEFLPFTLQFAFGGLFSAFTIFYSKSSSFVASAVFVVLMFGLMVGNEFFKERYSKLNFQIGIYFLAIFSFSIYFLPLMTKHIGAVMFLLSGAVSLAFIAGFVFLISRLAPQKFQEDFRLLTIVMLGIWVLMNIFYFTNIIPPIPLSLKSGNVYHSMEKKTGGGYIARGEKEASGLARWNLVKKIHLAPGEGAYVFSSVFSPAELDTEITHNWQYYDQENKKWVSASKITFPIVGGRNEGYRGFSKKENIFPGEWRVDVETGRGQAIGRVRFDIEIGNFVTELETTDL
jgi:hypothetical protein